MMAYASETAERKATGLIARTDEMRGRLEKMTALGTSIAGSIPRAEDKKNRAEPRGSLDRLCELIEDCVELVDVLGDQLNRINSQVGSN